MCARDQPHSHARIPVQHFNPLRVRIVGLDVCGVCGVLVVVDFAMRHA